MKYILYCLFGMCGIVQAAYAQQGTEIYPDLYPVNDTIIDVSPSEFPRLLELSVSNNTYAGDLGQFQKSSVAFHAALQFNRNRRLNGRVALSFGFITGNNRDYRFDGGTPNIYFNSKFFTLEYELQYNLFRNHQWRVYISQGIGLFNFTPRNQNGENLIDLLNTRADFETYNNSVLQLPTGIGIQYLFSNGFGFGIQTRLLNPQTAYLDNISQWGTRQRNDQVWQTKFSFYAPLQIIPPKYLKKSPPRRGLYTHN